MATPTWQEHRIAGNAAYTSGDTPAAVDASPPAAVTGVCDARGNVWQWTLDEAASAEGSPAGRQKSYAVTGGSWAGTGDPVTSTRFRAELRDLCAGFRYVVEAEAESGSL